ncbi:MAG TPA: LacI family transcriptional regulator [Firmicutes bacterium]|nr:LacI family transcriptional regulator [Bacillota bacterium]
MGVTIEDVARRAGVSVSTVSRALNRKGRISEQTRQRIFDIARELEYPTTPIQATPRRRSNTIGIMFNRHLRSLVSDPFYGLVMVGVEESLRQDGYHVLFSTLGERDEDMAAICGFASERRVDGLILAGCDVDREYIDRIVSLEIPLVLVDNNIISPKVPCVMTDNITGAREAVDHLIDLGHEDIAFVSGPMTHSSLYERHQGYRQALEARGLPVRQELSVIYEDVLDFSVEGGFAAATRLMSRSKKPTAIFAANDSLALGVMKAMPGLGLAVPGDVSVVGFDDVEAAAHTSPPLTTVRVDKTDLGRHAARLLSELIDGGSECVPYKISVCTELIVRGSTGPRPRE